MSELKKYPVIYKGKTYEVRWEKCGILNVLAIYEVTRKKTLFGMKNKYKHVYSEIEDIIERTLNGKHILSSSPKYFIAEINGLFKSWERYINARNKEKLIRTEQEIALTEWNGIIE